VTFLFVPELGRRKELGWDHFLPVMLLFLGQLVAGKPLSGHEESQIGKRHLCCYWRVLGKKGTPSRLYFDLWIVL
jgi:hypothetical protein